MRKKVCNICDRKKVFKSLFARKSFATDYIAHHLIIENEIEKLSNHDFTRLICMDSMALSHKTGREYLDILTEVKEMLLAGGTENEVLWHIDKQLYCEGMKHGKENTETKGD